MKCVHVSDDVWTGQQPQAEELKELSRRGVQAIVNLREPGESGDLTSSRDEGVQVRQMGIEYLNVPVPKQQISEAQIDDIRTKLTLLPRPVFIHCDSGARSGAIAVIDEAVRQGWSAEDAVERAKAAGLRSDEPGLLELVRRYLDDHRQADPGA
jgi:uncharacterized protein (TIGR01244 family)